MTNNSHSTQLVSELNSIDWSSNLVQQLWFSKFKSPDTDGLKLSKFHEFLQATLYKYFELFSRELDKSATNNIQNNNDNCYTNQQEMQLFKTFDQKNDHILDLEEFSYMCHKWLDRIFRPTYALVVVDVQNDFIDGSLALINGPAGQDGAEVVPVINNLLESNYFKTVVYTQDWHPVNHIGFHCNLHLRKYKLKDESSFTPGTNSTNSEIANELAVTSKEAREPVKYKKANPSAQVFDTVVFEDGMMEQKLWPMHCVQDSWGAQFHPGLKIVHDAIFIQKGTFPHIDAYSAFWDNMRMNETGLRQELMSRKITDVYFCGLALDYCVSASALDSAKAGFITFVIEDGCRGIDLEEMEHRRNELRENEVLIINSEQITGVGYGSDIVDGSSDTGNEIARSNLGRMNRNTIKSICFRRAMF